MDKIPEKLKKNKGIGIIVIALAAGIILLLWPTGGKSETTGGEFTYDSAEQYRKSLEAEVERVVGELKGIGDCEVMITLESGYEYLYASDQQMTGGDPTGSRKEYVLANRGGNEQPVLIEARMPAVSGVAVVCPGVTATGEYKIIRILSALFNLPANRISVTG